MIRDLFPLNPCHMAQCKYQYDLIMVCICQTVSTLDTCAVLGLGLLTPFIPFVNLPVSKIVDLKKYLLYSLNHIRI